MSLDKWVEVGAEEELIASFRSVIRAFPVGRKISIWGASVRGTILGYLMEKQGISEFDFIDNDKTKEGHYIGEHRVLYSDAVSTWDRQEHFIAVPIEYGDEIRKQLNTAGYTEGEDFAIIRSGTEEGYLAEFTKKGCQRLIFGDAQLVIADIDDEEPECVQTVLHEVWDDKETKFLAVSSLSLGHIYEFTRIQKKYFSPEVNEINIFLTFEMLAPWHYFMSRSQKAEILEKISGILDASDDEFEDYVRVAKVRASNYQIEKKYCPQRTSIEENLEGETVRNDYMKLVYGRRINEGAIPYLNLKRILVFCRDSDMKCNIILFPVNKGTIWSAGGAEYAAILDDNIQMLKETVVQHMGNWTDLSDILADEDFMMGASIANGVFGSGKKKLVSKLKKIV